MLDIADVQVTNLQWEPLNGVMVVGSLGYWRYGIMFTKFTLFTNFTTLSHLPGPKLPNVYYVFISTLFINFTTLRPYHIYYIYHINQPKTTTCLLGSHFNFVYHI
jgi:hypothetical protein